MEKIYIVLMHTNTIPAKLIKFATRSKYSHVGLSFEKDCTTIYSFGRRNVHSILNSGFTVENKNGPFFQAFHKTICKIYEVEVSHSKYTQIKKVIKEMQKNSNLYKYDFIGLILRFFRIPIRLKNRYVCSYFIASLLKEAENYPFQKESYFIKPKDFENISCWSEIYSGKYINYK